MPNKIIKLTCPCSYFQASPLIQTYCKCGHDVSHHNSRCVFTWSEEIKPHIAEKEEEFEAITFSPMSLEEQLENQFPQFLIDLRNATRPLNYNPGRRLHASQTYTVHDDVSKDYLTAHGSTTFRLVSYKEFTPDPNKRYMVKCNACSYIWNTARYGNIPKKCPSCKINLFGKPLYRDHHENPKYDKGMKFCRGCRKNWPAFYKVCEYCKNILTQTPHSSEFKKIDDSKRIDTSDVEDDYTKLVAQDKSKMAINKLNEIMEQKRNENRNSGN